ncbi:hypothetical protein MMPV_007149 [Pyropia vietnamensis]
MAAATGEFGLSFSKGDFVSVLRDTFAAGWGHGAELVVPRRAGRAARANGGGRNGSSSAALAAATSRTADDDAHGGFPATVYVVRPTAVQVVLPRGSPGAKALAASGSAERWRLIKRVNAVGYIRAVEAVTAAAAASLTEPGGTAGGGAGGAALARLLVRSFSLATVRAALAADGKTYADRSPMPWPIPARGADSLNAAARASPPGVAEDPPLPLAATALASPSRGRRAPRASRSPPWLNAHQAAAVAAAVSRTLTLIAGPPGTGKTATAAATVRRLVDGGDRQLGGRDGVRVLATAASHVAADHLARAIIYAGVPAGKVVRLGTAAAVGKDLWESTLDSRVAALLTRLGGEGRSSPDTDKDARLSRSVLADVGADAPMVRTPAGAASLAAAAARAEAVAAPAARAAATDAVLRAAAVVVTTCVGAGHEALAGTEFGAVVLDEATQTSEANALIPLFLPGREVQTTNGPASARRGRSCPQLLVLVGDDRQLSPTVLSEVAAANGLGVSLYRRLRGAGVAVTSLRVQYRMHPGIAAWPGATFYGAHAFKSGVKAVKRRLPPAWTAPGGLWRQKVPVTFVDVSRSGGDGESEWGGRGNRRPGAAEAVGEAAAAAAEAAAVAVAAAASPVDGGMTTFSYRNDREVATIVALAAYLLRPPPSRPKKRSAVASPPLTAARVGVLTPYAAQAQALSRALRADPATAAVETTTVDGFQGRQKDVILFSAVRSNSDGRVGFLADARRANVALTRARRGVVVVGDAQTLRHCPLWARWLDWVATEGRVIPAAELPTILKVSGTKAADIRKKA